MDSILEAMLARIPDIYDKSEGSIFYDALAALAPEIEQLSETASQILNDRFLDTAEGDALDRVVSEFGIERKAAGYAEGAVTFLGVANTVISAGALVASESVSFYTKTDCTIGSDGTVTVDIVCCEAGSIGNVGAESIVKLPVTLSGVTSVVNELPTSGGYDRETDDELRERAYIKIRTPGTSGNVNDYVSWAMSVDGVGSAKCLPLWNGAGTVKVVIADSSGDVASDELISAVEGYIETVRPVGADVTVVSAAAKQIDVTVTLELAVGYNEPLVSAAVKDAITRYLRTFGISDGAVSYARIGALILGVEGVKDYTDLSVNGGSANIELESTEIPVMGEFTNAA